MTRPNESETRTKNGIGACSAVGAQSESGFIALALVATVGVDASTAGAWTAQALINVSAFPSSHFITRIANAPE